MKRLTVLTVLFLPFLTPLALSQAVSPNNQRALVIEEFLAAFNAHDEAAMAALVSDDVQWLSIDGAAVSIEVEGKAALQSAMREYFASCPSCRSELGDLLETGTRISVVETASWDGRDGRKSQSAIAVYEFSGLLIQRVYYFPAE